MRFAFFRLTKVDNAADCQQRVELERRGIHEVTKLLAQVQDSRQRRLVHHRLNRALRSTDGQADLQVAP
ncbi:hypothetical protein D3C87_1945500 [compost metagenome]